MWRVGGPGGTDEGGLEAPAVAALPLAGVGPADVVVRVRVLAPALHLRVAAAASPPLAFLRDF